MKKLSIAMLSMVLAGSMLLTACGGGNTQQSETAENTEGGVLRMGTNATFPPYEYMDENNEVAGIDAEIAAAIADKLGIPKDKTVETVQMHGNTSAASVPLALDWAVKNGRIHEGDTVMLQGVGAGMTWGSVLLKW